MIIQILTLSLYFSTLLLPGYALVLLFQLKGNRYLLLHGLSISLVSLLVSVFQELNIESIRLLVIILGGFCAVSIVICFFKRKTFPLPIRCSPIAIARDYPMVVGNVVLVILIVTSHFYFGPYTEIPSDFWKHLARVNSVFFELSENGFAVDQTNSYFGSSQTSIVYFFHALAAKLIGRPPLAIASSVVLATTCLFLSTIYWFAIQLAGTYHVSNFTKAASGLAAALIMWVTFGTASFSFVRYYAYFPVILSFPLVYCSVSILSDFLERENVSGTTLYLIPIFLLAMWVIHRQEAMLTLIVLALVSVVRVSRVALKSSRTPPILKRRAIRLLQLFASSLFCFAFVILLTRSSSPWGQTPHVIDAGRYFSFLDGFPIDNPSFRLWDTVGLFGLGVYFWTLFRWRIIWRSDFLVAGLLIPLATNLNPLFTILFLHFGDETTVWRTAYLVPFGFTAAILFVEMVRSFSVRSRLRIRWLDLCIVTLLLASVLPWQINGQSNRTSKLSSFLVSNETSGALLWQDLIVEIERINAQQPVRQIITDSVTGFVINAAVRGKITSLQQREYFPKYNEHFKEDFLGSDFSRSLLIINRRNGAVTINAQISGHWPTNILTVSELYPAGLDRFVAQYHALFEPIWEKDNIQIYRFARFNSGSNN
jgi:hypothetical protein